MAKAKSTGFFCRECGYESSKWMGQCPACKAWNTMVEAPSAPVSSGTAAGRYAAAASLTAAPGKRVGAQAKPVSLDEIELSDTDRTRTGFAELDRVLGSGVVRGSLVLVGGDPGIGKSTLLLQVCRNLAGQEQKVLYVSGEESLKQIKLRASRIGTVRGPLSFLSETNLDTIAEVIREVRPDVVVIDSIQTMFIEAAGSAPGSVSQVRECTGVLMQLAKGQRGGQLRAGQCIPGPGIDECADADCKGNGDFDLYRRSCDERGRCGGTAYAGTYGRYSAIF